jgi:hypothetical protein
MYNWGQLSSWYLFFSTTHELKFICLIGHCTRYWYLASYCWQLYWLLPKSSPSSLKTMNDERSPSVLKTMIATTWLNILTDSHGLPNTRQVQCGLIMSCIFNSYTEPVIATDHSIKQTTAPLTTRNYYHLMNLFINACPPNKMCDVKLGNKIDIITLY